MWEKVKSKWKEIKKDWGFETHRQTVTSEFLFFIFYFLFLWKTWPIILPHMHEWHGKSRYLCISIGDFGLGLICGIDNIR